MTIIKSVMGCAMALMCAACIESISATPDDLGVDQMIYRDIGQFAVDVHPHTDSDCRRVLQTIERIWYVACRDRGQLIVRIEE